MKLFKIRRQSHKNALDRPCLVDCVEGTTGKVKLFNRAKKYVEEAKSKHEDKWPVIQINLKVELQFFAPGTD